uniref:Uncharacterized protein n=1 Tax=Anguilla anguilla TaxID=7936 RepID=A0A0E9UAQ8_ANGAN
MPVGAEPGTGVRGRKLLSRSCPSRHKDGLYGIVALFGEETLIRLSYKSGV